MEPIKNIIARSELYLYLKYRDRIDQHYNYALKEGWAGNEDADWRERTDYWRRSE